MKLLGVLFLTIITVKSYCQFSIQAGTQIPLFYTVGGEYKLNDRFGFNVQVGLMTSPYDKIILDTYESLSDDEALTNTIGGAFSYGFLFEPTIKYYINKTYVGLNYSYINLVAKDAPQDAIENYYNIDLTSVGNPLIKTRPKEINLSSALHNMGILVGRQIDLNNPKLKLGLELWLAKTFSSESKVSANNRDLSTLSSEINKELDKIYVKFGYLATINIFLSYSLNKAE